MRKCNTEKRIREVYKEGEIFIKGKKKTKTDEKQLGRIVYNTREDAQAYLEKMR